MQITKKIATFRKQVSLEQLLPWYNMAEERKKDKIAFNKNELIFCEFEKGLF